MPMCATSGFAGGRGRCCCCTSACGLAYPSSELEDAPSIAPLSLLYSSAWELNKLQILALSVKACLVMLTGPALLLGQP